ncbi:regulator of nonsense transcripts 3A [Caerostris darwini]|uniref:Regulator of nonsense transcripts 3A n=1 Tax=Caerostris darwini TaxID=1538125 RepID=A0AAV4V4E3_9ARAC|nr:regulator of nonsense transcripts 3A [Caerostris darwini]
MSTIGYKARDNSGGRTRRVVTSESYKFKMKREKTFLTKVVIRRLPPTMTEDQFLDQISPVPDHDYMYFAKADMRLGPHAFSRAVINFLIPEDIFLFKDKFDGYVFVDNKGKYSVNNSKQLKLVVHFIFICVNYNFTGNEYPAVVEFAPFQKIPKKRNPKKRDAKCGTIENDPDYLKFLESLKNPDEVALPTAEVYLEEIESREKELKANNGVPKVSTPLIEYLTALKKEQQKIREEKKEERKRKEMEKKRIREEERRRRKAEKDKERAKEKFKEKESLSEKETTDDHEESSSVSDTLKHVEPVVQVLKNPEREKDQKEVVTTPQKSKDYYASSRVNKDKDRNKKEWERMRPKERQKAPVRTYFNSEKDRSRREKADYKLDKLYSNKKPGFHENPFVKKKEVKETDGPSEDSKKDNSTGDYKKDNTVEDSKTDKSIEDSKEDKSAEDKPAEDSKMDKSGEDTKDKSIDKYKEDKSVEDFKEDNADLDTKVNSQWPTKDKRDSSCPGNVESLGSQKDKNEISCKEFKNSPKSVTSDDVSNVNEASKSDSNNDYKDREKDPRTERRIRNKDRPSIEIYRPGMRRFSQQRNSPHKEISTSASNSSSPSPTPSFTVGTVQAHVKNEDGDKISPV